jgi:uncharacterized protein YbjT (DUF2867 family)
MITVLGAGGNTGSKITQVLLSKGEAVRAVGRSAAKFAPLKKAGAEVAIGDLTDSGFLTRAFSGTSAAYTLLPTDRTVVDYRGAQDRQGEAIAKAIGDSGVRYVVALSSLGADLPTGTGVIEGLHAQEQRLRGLERVNVLLLRPVSFFENFYGAFDLIRHQGIIADTVNPDLALPMIATRDIAEAAADALIRRNWDGIAVRELLGPRDYTHAECARMIGECLEKPDLTYVQLPDDDMTQAMVQAGLSESFSRLYVAMTRSFNEGKIGAKRNADNTTPTKFEDFAEELAQAYRAS